MSSPPDQGLYAVVHRAMADLQRRGLPTCGEIAIAAGDVFEDPQAEAECEAALDRRSERVHAAVTEAARRGGIRARLPCPRDPHADRSRRSRSRACALARRRDRRPLTGRIDRLRMAVLQASTPRLRTGLPAGLWPPDRSNRGCTSTVPATVAPPAVGRSIKGVAAGPLAAAPAATLTKTVITSS